MSLFRIAAAACLAATPALAQTTYSADLSGPDGTDHGTVTLEPTASGLMIVTLDLQSVPAGEHGVHLHETGDCSAEDFSSAGGHLADGRDHGVLVETGPHPGDLPNVLVGDDGNAEVTFFDAFLTEDLVTDADGTAFIVHAGADDYESQPSGDAGARIACGVFE